MAQMRNDRVAPPKHGGDFGEVVSGINETLDMTWALPILLASQVALARPGSHAPAVSTYDTRASSMVLAYNQRFFRGGQLGFASFNTNFTSTNGNLSAQFGLHFLHIREEGRDLGLGLSAGVVPMYSVPLTGRHKNGIPRMAFAFYGGPVPTIIVGNSFTDLSVPFVVGAGLPLGPTDWLTVIPAVEGSVSIDAGLVVSEHVLNIDDLLRKRSMRT